MQETTETTTSETTADRVRPAIRQAYVELLEADERLGRACVALQKAIAFRELRGEEDEDVTRELEEVRDELGVALIEVHNTFEQLDETELAEEPEAAAEPS